MSVANMCLKSCKRPSRQRGAALAVCLVILLVLTVLGVNSMQSLVLEERMAGNARQAMVSSQAAEIAVRSAEAWLINNFTNSSNLNWFSNGVAGLYAQRTTAPGANALLKPEDSGLVDIFDEDNWTNANSVEVDVESFDPAGLKDKLVGEDPRYIIEYIGRVGERPLDPNNKKADTRDYAFRITGIGFGEDIRARSLVQSTFFVTL